MSKKRSNALRKEQEMMTHNRHTQTFYQRHQTESNTIQFNPQKQRRPINLVPKSVNQEDYILALTNPKTDVVVISGPAGTGKTYLAILAAIQAYRNKECERIVLCRPSISVDNESHGFLPGDLTAKLEPWVKPMIDVFREFYAVKEIEHMLSEQIIECAPLGMLRGRTFKNTWVIMDEAQNATPTQFKMILTRIGEGSKMVIMGDVEQTDRKTPDNGLLDLQHRLVMSPIPGLEVCRFDARDIRRHRIIEHVLLAYDTP
jgi:phosphate starvation-inducible PhoH-like protein